MIRDALRIVSCDNDIINIYFMHPKNILLTSKIYFKKALPQFFMLVVHFHTESTFFSEC